MNHAKKVQSTAEGYPIVNGTMPKPVTSYSLKKLRKGMKHPETVSDFRPSARAAKDFEEKVLFGAVQEPEAELEPKVKSDLLEDIKQEVLPLLSKTFIGLVAHAEAVKGVISKTVSFTSVSVRAISTSVKMVLHRAYTRA